MDKILEHITFISQARAQIIVAFGFDFLHKSNIHLAITKDSYIDYENSLVYVKQKN